MVSQDAHSPGDSNIYKYKHKTNTGIEKTLANQYSVQGDTPRPGHTPNRRQLLMVKIKKTETF